LRERLRERLRGKKVKSGTTMMEYQSKSINFIRKMDEN